MGYQNDGPAHSVLIVAGMPELNFTLTPTSAIHGRVETLYRRPGARDSDYAAQADHPQRPRRLDAERKHEDQWQRRIPFCRFAHRSLRAFHTAYAGERAGDGMLSDPRSRRFIDAFLDYWLDLRKLADTDPSSTLYPDYYLDEGLTEAALDETHLYFQDLVRLDLPAGDLIDSDFTFVNERLARHYGVPGVIGAAMRRVRLPPGSSYAGHNDPGKRSQGDGQRDDHLPGDSRTLYHRAHSRDGHPASSSVPAVTPDLRGAITIREQLARHRSDPSCAGVRHSKMDPPGFALESFDVMGGWRDRYRGISDDSLPAAGIGQKIAGFPFAFHYALLVDSTGEMPDGRRFQDVRELKRLLLRDEAAIARNLVRQLLVYATGTPVRFSDRAEVEAILEKARPREYRVRDLINALIQSDLFLEQSDFPPVKPMPPTPSRVPFVSTRTPLSRRHFLKGAGILLALPLLDSMRPVFAKPGAAFTGPAKPRRLAPRHSATTWVSSPGSFFPKGEGSDYTPSP